MAEKKSSTQSDRKWQSDVIADLIKQFGFPYIPLNPGASYRGLHDSLVNYNGDDPPMLLSPAREDRGADRARLREGVRRAALRDRAQRRRPAARDHGHLLRLHGPRARVHHRRDRPDGRRQAPSARRLGAHRECRKAPPCATSCKWDYQPGGIQGVPDSFARAYSIMMTEPQGPIYMCYDAALQEARAHRNGEAARSEDAESAGQDRARHDGACEDRGQACRRRMAGAAAAICRPRRKRHGRHGRACRDHRRCRCSTCMSRLNFPTEHPLDCRHEQEDLQARRSDRRRSIAATGRARPTTTTASTAR